ncbi:crAss001_48 related protein [Vibrio nigripulchritudo]|uniref:crAss001_48 related protein n=1 Tax=Vibrio nigripulchritudo TaxID=28173 RepID=UPI002493B002|nr:hypothetical protein [Vibrio nigripulchritudo]BDU42883.1 hypothetical protein TUMSATVNIG3_16810 [Vibrio nigripulchritudo]
MNRPDHLKRMDAELLELREKTRKLERFVLSSEKCLALCRLEQVQLSIQLGSMIAYGNILQERISYTEKKLKGES